MKKLISLVLALAMVLVCCAVAFADDDGAITVTSTSTPGEGLTTTYEAYRIFDIKPAVDNNGDPILNNAGSFTSVTYTIADKWTGFFETTTGASYLGTSASPATAPQIIVDGAIKYINISEGNVEDFAKAALAYSQSAPIAPDATSTDGAFTGLKYGYWMVYPKGASINESTYASIVSLTNTNPSQSVVQKATFPNIVKTDDQTDLELGGVVNYTITGTVPNTAGFTSYEYTVKDTMSNGLTFNDDIVVTIGSTDVTSACTIVKTGINETFRVTIPVMDYQDPAYINATITITYSATINENALVKSTLQEKNKAELVYSNDPKDNTKKTTTPPDEEKVYTSNLVIDKYEDGAPTKKLSGAKFVLYKMDGENKVYYKLNDADGTTHKTKYVTWVALANATEVTTDNNGAASFQGLENGNYWLEETQAPDGYNKLTNDVSVRIAGNDADEIGVVAEADVPNNQGTVLPSTGGIGTTIFYILGGLLVVGAAVILVARRKASN